MGLGLKNVTLQVVWRYQWESEAVERSVRQKMKKKKNKERISEEK